MDKKATELKASKSPVIILAVILIVATVSGGYLYYRSEESSLRNEYAKHLHAITELKINQVIEWQKERMGDALVLSKSPFIREAVEKWIADPTDQITEKKLLERLRLFEEYFEYEDILLVSPSASLLMNLSHHSENLNSELKKFIVNYNSSQELQVHDFYRPDHSDKILIEYVAPIRNYLNTINCFIVIQVDPQRSLFPKIRTWPVSSNTSETLIVRQDEDDVLFLNELRFYPNSALNLRYPLAESKTPAAEAVRGFTGLIEANDYRGIRVLADVGKISGTPWFIVTKTDFSEIFTELRYKAGMAAVLGLMFIAFVIAVIISWHNNKQKEILRELLQKEKELRLAQEEFRTTLYSIGDAVITTDVQGKIKQMNPVAEEMTGWLEQEARGQDLPEVFRIINESTRENVANPVDRVLREDKVVGLANHTILISKSGREICIADSGAPIRSAHNEILGVVLVFRDQTEERKAELALIESESRFRSLFENMAEGVALHELVRDAGGNAIDYRVMNINSRYESILGLSRENTVGKTATEIYEVSAAPYLEEYSMVALTGKPYQFTTHFPPMDKYFDISVAPWGQAGFATIFSDISERKKAEIMLRDLNQRMSLHYRNTPLAVIEWDKNFRVTSWNSGAERVFGYTASEAIGKTGTELIIPPELTGQLSKVWNSLLDQHGGSKNTNENITKDGKRVLAEWYNTTLIDGQGNVLGVASLCHDITEQKRSEDQLRRSEEKFRSLYDNVDIGLYRTTPTGQILMANKTLIRMLGYDSFEELAKLNLESGGFESPESRRRFKELLEAEGNIVGYEARFYKKDGSIIYLRENSKAIVNGQGDILYYDGSLEDITEERETQERLLKFLKAVEQSPVEILITDINGNIEYINPKVTEATGYTPREVIGQNPRIFKSGHMAAIDYKIMWDTLLSGQEWRGEFLNKKKDGTLYWEDASISPLKNEKGEITHFVAVKEDITERKQMISELIEAKEKAEEMNRIKSNFFSNMSHELRTPLIGILGYSEVMQDYLNGQDDLLQMVQTIHSGGRRLLDTLNLILNISKIESAKIEVHKSNVNVCEVIKEVHKLYTPLAAQKNISFYCNLVTREIICPLDEKLFFDAMNNLVNNAIKYTNSGKVWISIASVNGKAKIEVGDTGIGIPKGKHNIIWEAFRQASEGFGRSFEGSGLGLTITKRYIELMDGAITLESDEGKGAVFSIEFPALNYGIDAKESDSGGAGFESASGFMTPMNKKPVLLMIEDDPIVISLVGIFLGNSYTLDFSTNASDALDKVSKRKYDALLMDINLRRGMDGVQLTEKIRKLPAYSNTPIIAVTAYAMEKDKDEFLSHGLTHYLSKPFEKEQLIKLLNEVFPNN